MPWGEFKDIAAERRLFQRRATVMLLLVFVLLGLLIARMYQLQVVEHDIYTTLSDKNRVQVQSVAPPRGLVYDRNDVLLAENRPVFSSGARARWRYGTDPRQASGYVKYFRRGYGAVPSATA